MEILEFLVVEAQVKCDFRVFACANRNVGRAPFLEAPRECSILILLVAVDVT